MLVIPLSLPSYAVLWACLTRVESFVDCSVAVPGRVEVLGDPCRVGGLGEEFSPHSNFFALYINVFPWALSPCGHF